MQTVFSRLMSQGTAPTRQDIADLLASIAPPGEKRDEKTVAVRELFDELGVPGTGFQGGLHVADTLDLYEEY